MRPGGSRRLPPATHPIDSLRAYCCGEFSIWLLQVFFASLFDSFGWFACSEATQSFICCLWDLLALLLWLLLFIPLLLEVEVEGEVLG